MSLDIEIGGAHGTHSKNGVGQSTAFRIDDDDIIDGKLEDYEINDMSFVFHKSDDDQARRRMRGNIFIGDGACPIKLAHGTIFTNKNHFRRVLKDYKVQRGFKLKGL